MLIGTIRNIALKNADHCTVHRWTYPARRGFMGAVKGR